MQSGSRVYACSRCTTPTLKLVRIYRICISRQLAEAFKLTCAVFLLLVGQGSSLACTDLTWTKHGQAQPHLSQLLSIMLPQPPTSCTPALSTSVNSSVAEWGAYPDESVLGLSFGSAVYCL